MVLMAGSNEEAKPTKEVTPFQNWFNKNQLRLAEEFSKKNKIETVDLKHKDKFMKYAHKEFEKR